MSSPARATLLALAVTSAACGGGSTAAPDLSGTWSASRFQLASTSSSASVDLIALGGTSTAVLRSDRTYLLTSQLPGQLEDSSSGTWEASSDVLTLHESGGATTMQFSYTLSGSTLTLTGADAEYDFDQDGTPEPAKLSVTAHRG